MQRKDLGCEEARGCQALAMFGGMGGGDAASGEAERKVWVVGVADEVRGCGEPKEPVETRLCLERLVDVDLGELLRLEDGCF